MPRRDLAPDVAAQILLLEQFLNASDAHSRKPCDAKCGIYAFYDFDGAPIYVGQTRERLRVRIRRHLTNKRTDAVAMNVLDPMEVAEIEVWPLWELEGEAESRQQQVLNQAEYTIYMMLNETRGAIGNLLNEVMPPTTDLLEIPESYKQNIVPETSRQRLYHPDERISRRASTIAALAQVVKERDVSLGLRRTLVTQAKRLFELAQRRNEEVLGRTSVAEADRELTGTKGLDTGEP